VRAVLFINNPAFKKSIFLEDGLEEFGGRLAQHFADFKNESGRKKYFQTSDPPKNRGLGLYLY
jgi:hypothetical protein